MQGSRRHLPGPGLRKDPQAGENQVNKPLDIKARSEGISARTDFGVAPPRGYGALPPLTPEASAALAVELDAARTSAAAEGRTLVYILPWDGEE